MLLDYPSSVAEAELMEEYRGGINAFVHLSLPDEILVDIEENKMKCSECSKVWFKNDIKSEQHGIHIEAHNARDFSCDCDEFVDGSDPAAFEKDLEEYKKSKDDLLAFYNHYALLVDFPLRNGYEDYDKIKKQIQYNIKH